MQALKHFRYGGIEQLSWRDTEQPIPSGSQVLVKLHACSLNASDIELITGKPAYARVYGLRKPRIHNIGSDIVGTIVKVGDHVKNWQVGQRIFADNFDFFGGLAEYCTVPEKRLMHLPNNLDACLAACIPQAGAIAQQAINKLPAQAKHIMIVGAGGGAGHLCVQLARRLGLEVSGIDHASKLSMIAKLGCHHTYDCKHIIPKDVGHNYDLILDLVGSHPYRHWLPKLSDGGQYLIVGGPLNRVLSSAMVAPLHAKLNGKKAGVLALKQQPEQALQLAKQVVEGELTPHIDTKFAFKDAKAALAKQMSGLVKGKVVIEFEI